VNVFFTGGTGFIGHNTIDALVARGDRCTVVSRSGAAPWTHDGVRVVKADPRTAGAWQEEIARADAVVNLAGAPLVEPPKRWSDAQKAEIVGSRIETTRRVVEAVLAAGKSLPLLSGSAVGYYGTRGDDVLDEESGPGSGFLSDVVLEWEQAARRADTVARVVLLRTGIALGKGGGALAPMLTPFKLGVGGPWGEGTQWWPWIHIADVVGLILFLLDRPLNGPFNLAAPNPTRVRAFAHALGRALHRPAVARVPEVILRMVLGEAADALLCSQRVEPRRALDAGYVFRYSELDAALADVVS